MNFGTFAVQACVVDAPNVAMSNDVQASSVERGNDFQIEAKWKFFLLKEKIGAFLLHHQNFVSIGVSW